LDEIKVKLKPKRHQHFHPHFKREKFQFPKGK